MKFLVVLLVIFFYRNWMGDNPVRRFVAFESYMDWFKDKIGTTNVSFLLCIGLPVLVVFLVSAEIRYWLLGLPFLVFALGVMLYAIDVHDTELAFDDEAQRLRALPENTAIAEARQRQSDFRLLSTYDTFQGLYPALFWFLVLGPGGAMLYVLSRQYLDGLHDDDPENDLVDRVLYLLEWPPAQLTGLLFALLGRFGECFDTWLDGLTGSGESIAGQLVRLASAASLDHRNDEPGDIPSFARESELANAELKDLLDRTAYGWLALAALVTIIGF